MKPVTIIKAKKPPYINKPFRNIHRVQVVFGKPISKALFMKVVREDYPHHNHD